MEQKKRKTYTSTKVKARYNGRHYDRVLLLFKKGEKDAIQAYASSQGLTVNAYANKVIRELLGVPEEEWKPLYLDERYPLIKQ